LARARLIRIILAGAVRQTDPVANIEAFMNAIGTLETRLSNALVKAPSKVVGAAHFSAQTRV
jgi:hypothetical protein